MSTVEKSELLNSALQVIHVIGYYLLFFVLGFWMRGDIEKRRTKRPSAASEGESNETS